MFATFHSLSHTGCVAKYLRYVLAPSLAKAYWVWLCILQVNSPNWPGKAAGRIKCERVPSVVYTINLKFLRDRNGRQYNIEWSMAGEDYNWRTATLAYYSLRIGHTPDYKCVKIGKYYSVCNDFIPTSCSDNGLLLHTLSYTTHQTGNRSGLSTQTDNEKVSRETATD